MIPEIIKNKFCKKYLHKFPVDYLMR